MEKNIHDDRLDDYVKGSFDDYAENPAPDMWERIERQLPEGERKPAWYAWRRFGWPTAAALAILMLITRLVCVESYYEEKLQKISAQEEQAAQNTVKDAAPYDRATPSKTDEKLEDEPKAQSPANHLAPSRNTAANSHTTARKKQQTIVQAPNTFARGAGKTGNKDNLAGPSNTLPESLNTGLNQRSPTAQTTGTNNVTSTQKSENQDESAPAQQRGATGAQSFTLSKQPDFQTLAQKTPALSSARLETPTALAHAPLIAHHASFNIETPTALATPTIKHKEATGWYMGVFVTPHYTVEKTTQTVRPGPRRLFISQQERPQVSSDISLRFGKKINSRFAIESGLGYQHLNRTATHLARFEYREGQTIQNPSGAESRSFDYDLNTYGGSASVSLRMEVAGGNAPAALERVGALITSKESLQILQVPVLGVARLGQGRVKAVLKAGLLGSYLLKNSFEITAHRLENTKLRFRSQDGYTVQFSRPQRFIWGYQLSAGAEFRLTKSLSLSAAPTLSGDFQRKDPQQGKLPEQTAVGMNLGLVWWF